MCVDVTVPRFTSILFLNDAVTGIKTIIIVRTYMLVWRRKRISKTSGT